MQTIELKSYLYIHKTAKIYLITVNRLAVVGVNKTNVSMHCSNDCRLLGLFRPTVQFDCNLRSEVVEYVEKN
jgi:hypothetical protein